MIEVRIIADSISERGHRLTTWELTYPRFIHSEFMTHRMLSKNAASSRAIPIQKMIDAVKENPAMPVKWGKNQSGMQAYEELDDLNASHAKAYWLQARDDAVLRASLLAATGAHKQIVNRILEPFMHMTVVCSGTEFQNFFLLRAHPMAQPEIQELAYKMKAAYESHEPRKLLPGDWHLPYVTEEEYTNNNDATCRIMSTARCARVSYTKQSYDSTFAKDVELHDRLVSSYPRHLSPTEHPAQCMDDDNQYGNFTGWKQYRKFFEGEDGRVVA